MVGLMGWGGGVAAERGWRKGPWTPEEDKLLNEYVTFHGEGRWSSVARCAGLNRSGKSCRLRWVNYLRPGLKRGHITPQEEGIIIELHALWGNKWSTIARYLPGRTDNEIKNFWRTHFKKKEKCTQQQERRRAQMLKAKQEQKLQEDHHDHLEGNSSQVGNILEAQAINRQEDHQGLPMLMNQASLLRSWSDILLGDEGLFMDRLWNFEDDIHANSSSNKSVAMQNNDQAIYSSPSALSSGGVSNSSNNVISMQNNNEARSALAWGGDFF